MSFEDRYRQRVEEARAAFIARAADQSARLRELAEAGNSVGLRDIAHQLRGTAGTIGFAAISDQAGALEDAIDAGASDARAITEALARALEAMGNG